MMMSVNSIRALKLMMPIVAAISLMTQFIAILTNDWLHTVESMPNPNYEKFGMPADLEFFRKYTTSGLWTLCYNDPPDIQMQCVQIDYFSQEEYIPDQNDSTMAIPYAVKKAAIYIMISTALLVIGQIIYFMSQIFRSRRIYILVSGIPFILAGLLILTGIVVYISTFKNEVGYKLRPISQFQDALFDYRYGYSFLFLVASLLLCELSGTLSIFLYVSQKHFKIMIDSERDEVLKYNIINILRNQQQHPKPPAPTIITDPDGMVDTSMAPGMAGPRLQITNDDYDVSDIQMHSGNQSPLNQNFLSPDFGIDSAYYHCGRHGSRGRRNSRSNESYLGSPRESTADLKAAAVAAAQQRKVADNNTRQMIYNKNSIDDNINVGELQELYVGGLLQMTSAHLPIDLMTKPFITKRHSIQQQQKDQSDQELSMSYPVQQFVCREKASTSSSTLNTGATSVTKTTTTKTTTKMLNKQHSTNSNNNNNNNNNNTHLNNKSTFV